MKKTIDTRRVIQLIILIILISMFQSCVTTKKHKGCCKTKIAKKHKGCNGNGGWYTNRNL